MDERNTAILGVIAAFAVPNPGCFSQQSVFSGSAVPAVAHLGQITQPTLDVGLRAPDTLSAIDGTIQSLVYALCSERNH